MLLQFRNASPPGVDEPIADLCTTVSSLVSRRSSRANLSHCQTGARAEHLLLLLGGIGMSKVLLEPLFEHVRNVPGQIASSLLRRLRGHVFGFELYRPVIATLVLMSVVTGGYRIVRCRRVRRARGLIWRRFQSRGTVVSVPAMRIAVAVVSYGIVRRWVAVEGVVLGIIRRRWRRQP